MYIIFFKQSVNCEFSYENECLCVFNHLKTSILHSEIENSARKKGTSIYSTVCKYTQRKREREIKRDMWWNKVLISEKKQVTNS